MKGAQTQVAVASPLQLDKFTDDIDDVDAVQYFLYGMWCDQGCEDTKVPVARDVSFEEHFIHKHPALIAFASVPGRQGTYGIRLDAHMFILARCDIYIKDAIHGRTFFNRLVRLQFPDDAQFCRIFSAPDSDEGRWHNVLSMVFRHT